MGAVDRGSQLLRIQDHFREFTPALLRPSPIRLTYVDRFLGDAKEKRIYADRMSDKSRARSQGRDQGA
jgi:hypothetical protein